MHFIAVAIPAKKLPNTDYLQYAGRIAGFEILEYVENVSLAMSHLPKHENCWAVIFAVDVMPLPPRGNIENPRIFSLHREFRKITKNGIIACSKNQEQTRHIAGALLSDTQRREFFFRCQSLEDKYKNKDEIVKVLRNGPYSKIEVVRKNGKNCVRKTFYSYQRACLNREIKVRTELSHMDEISPLIESGANHFVMPYYQSHIEWMESPLSPFPIERARAAILTLQKMWDNGWAMLDHHPENFLFFADGSIKITDLEHASPLDKTETEFKNSYLFSSQWPKKYREVMWPGESKKTRKAASRTWQEIWQPLTGLDYDEVFAPQNTLLDLKKRISVLGKTPNFLAKKVRKKVRNRIRAHRQNHAQEDDRWIYLPLQKRYFCDR